MEVKIQKEISAELIAFKKDGVTTQIEKENTMKPTDELLNLIEDSLIERVSKGDRSAYFPLAQFFFEQGKHDKATLYFERSKNYDIQSLYQLGVIYYDGLGCHHKPIKGVQYLMEVAKCNEPEASHLIHAAQYNVGRACYQGYGVARQSDKDAERWWLLAASDGDPKASVKAQSTLGLFYSGEANMDLKKAFFWHSEACGNGSLQSQGALGVMYAYGLGVERNLNSAYICLKEASERGNVYAMGGLVAHYYDMKLFTKAADLSANVSQLTLAETTIVARDTNCLVYYVRKAVSLSCFYHGRCLQEGHGIKKDPIAASHYYSMSYCMDQDMCAYLQSIATHGLI